MSHHTIWSLAAAFALDHVFPFFKHFPYCIDHVFCGLLLLLLSLLYIQFPHFCHHFVFVHFTYVGPPIIFFSINSLKLPTSKSSLIWWLLILSFYVPPLTLLLSFVFYASNFVFGRLGNTHVNTGLYLNSFNFILLPNFSFIYKCFVYCIKSVTVFILLFTSISNFLVFPMVTLNICTSSIGVPSKCCFLLNISITSVSSTLIYISNSTTTFFQTYRFYCFIYFHLQLWLQHHHQKHILKLLSVVKF